MTKAQKRQEWRKFWQHGQGEGTQDINFGAVELRQLQHTDESLAEIRLLGSWRRIPLYLAEESDSLDWRRRGRGRNSWSLLRNVERQFSGSIGYTAIKSLRKALDLVSANWIRLRFGP